MLNVSELGKVSSLMILQNRSSHLPDDSNEVCFDFLKPSQRIIKETGARSSDDNSNCNMSEGTNNFTNTKLWSLTVRTISYLFITTRYILVSIIFFLNCLAILSCHFKFEFPPLVSN